MITIGQEQLALTDPRERARLLKLFAGGMRTESQEIPSPLDSAVSEEEILDRFYNGGVFRAIHSVFMSNHARVEGVGDEDCRVVRYTFREPVRPGHKPTALTCHPNGGVLSLGVEKRHYTARYYPDTHRLHARSYYLDRIGRAAEHIYDFTLQPDGLDCHYPVYDPQKPEATRLVIARTAIKQLSSDLALDLSHGASGA